MYCEGRWNGKAIRTPPLKKKMGDTCDNSISVERRNTEETTFEQMNFKKPHLNCLNLEKMLSKEKKEKSFLKILESISIIFEFKIHRMPGEDFGFKLSLKDNNDWIIESTVLNSPVDRIGFGQCLKILPGDRIISINSYPISMLHIPSFINDLPLLIRLRIQRHLMMEDNFLKTYSLKPYEINLKKTNFQQLINKLEKSIFPIKNYIKVNRFLFEFFSQSGLISNDIIVKINNVDLYGLSVPEIEDLIYCFDEYLILTILRESHKECIEDNQKEVSFIDSKQIKQELKLQICPICNLSKDSETSSDITFKRSTETITLLNYPKEIRRRKPKFGSIKRINRKFKSTTYKSRKKRKRLRFKVTNPLMSDLTIPKENLISEEDNKNNINHLSHTVGTQTTNVSNQEPLSKNSNENYESYPVSHVNVSENSVDLIIKDDNFPNFFWENLEKRLRFWNSIDDEVNEKVDLCLTWNVFKRYPLVIHVEKSKPNLVNHRIQLGDILFHLNNEILAHNTKTEVNSRTNLVNENEIKLRIKRNISIEQKVVAEKSKVVKNGLAEITEIEKRENTSDPLKGILLKLELEKTDVIGFFIEGGNGQPIAIRKMYSGLSGEKMSLLLRPGDIIVSVNETSFLNVSYEMAFKTLKALDRGKFHMEILRKF